eukprot:jgi/Mesen1/6489/ME000331S05607
MADGAMDSQYGEEDDEVPLAVPMGPRLRRTSSESVVLGSNNMLGRPYRQIRDKYSLRQELGRGTNAVVRLCIDRATGERLACKIIDKRYLQASVDGVILQRELDVMSILSDLPSVVGLRAAYEDAHLFERIRRRRYYPEAQAARVCAELARAVHSWQARGVVHRDLKPENILLRCHLSHTAIKVADFGTAVRLAPGQKLSGLAGSSYYLAPEVLDRCYGPEVDMWSLGVVAYILLAGMPPFRHPTDEGIFAAIRAGVYDTVSGRWCQVSQDGKDFVRALLVQDPAARMTPAQALEHPWLVTYCSRTTQAEAGVGECAAQWDVPLAALLQDPVMSGADGRDGAPGLSHVSPYEAAAAATVAAAAAAAAQQGGPRWRAPPSSLAIAAAPSHFNALDSPVARVIIESPRPEVSPSGRKGSPRPFPSLSPRASPDRSPSSIPDPALPFGPRPRLVPALGPAPSPGPGPLPAPDPAPALGPGPGPAADPGSGSDSGSGPGPGAAGKRAAMGSGSARVLAQGAPSFLRKPVDMAEESSLADSIFLAKLGLAHSSPAAELTLAESTPAGSTPAELILRGSTLGEPTPAGSTLAESTLAESIILAKLGLAESILTKLTPMQSTLAESTSALAESTPAQSTPAASTPAESTVSAKGGLVEVHPATGYRCRSTTPALAGRRRPSTAPSEREGEAGMAGKAGKGSDDPAA